MRDYTKLDNPTAIACPTKEIWKELLGILNEDGFKWYGGDSLERTDRSIFTNWKNYKDQTLVHIRNSYNEDNRYIKYGSIRGNKTGIHATATVLTFKEFIETVSSKETIIGTYPSVGS